jgi:hypothetical protein
VRLEPADLVNARADLADVRVIDAEGRQWPYLLERDVVTSTVPLVMASANREGRQARYVLAPSSQPLRMQGIELDVDAGFVDRPFTLTATDGDAARTLASGRLRRSAGERGPLQIPFADTRAAQLELVVVSGDEAPLAVSAARALAPISELYVPAPPGTYALLVGDAEARVPQYEIASVREAVLALPAVDAVTDPGGPNPSYSSGAVAAQRIAEGRLLPRIAVWVVLVLAVVVLTLLTLRLVRKDGPASAS